MFHLRAVCNKADHFNKDMLILILLVLVVIGVFLYMRCRAPQTLEDKFNDISNSAAGPGGLLISMISDDDAAHLLAIKKIDYGDFDQCAAVNRKTCSAWSYFRRDLWPAAFIIPGMNMNLGFITDPKKLWPLITTMSVIDGDTNFRSACSNENGGDTWLTYARGDDCIAKAFRQGPYASDSTGQIYSQKQDIGAADISPKCSDKDTKCRYLNSGAGINVWDLMYNWPCQDCGEFKPGFKDNIYYQTFKNCEACKKPYLCKPAEPPASGPNPAMEEAEIAAYVGKDSKQWPSLFTTVPPNIGFTAVHQCKFAREDWKAWTLALKEFYSYLWNNPLTLDPRAPVYLENEVNTYIYPDRGAAEYKRQQEIFLNSIVGVFYIANTCEEQIHSQDACDAFFSIETAARRSFEAKAVLKARGNAVAIADIYKAQTDKELPVYAARLQSNTYVDKTSMEAARAGNIKFKDLFQQIK
jgi:hypothetical protein